MMKRSSLFLLSCLAGVLSLSGAGDAVVQYSSYTGLLQRLFDGFVSYEQALEDGDHGVGTTDGLNGEVIILEGKPYRINDKGEAEVLEGDVMTPYVTIADTRTEPTWVVDLPAGVSYEELTATIIGILGEKFVRNLPHAVRIEGNFRKVVTRSVPKLEKPYPALTAVAEKQSIFNFSDKAFTLIGFWNPPYARAFNPPQWHIHGLNGERNSGGHVLMFETGEGVQLKLWKKTGFVIHQPDTEAFAGADFDQDMSAAVQKVNRD